jgi:general secretion pathway protein D
MIRFNKITAGTLAFMLSMPPAPLLFGKTRKGDKLRNDARTEEIRGNFDKALELALAAVEQDPADPAYVLELRRVRFEAGMVHLSAGHRLRDAGRLEEALAEFQRSAQIDPSSDVSAQEVRRTKQMIERDKNGGVDPAASLSREEAKILTPVQLARRQSELRTDALLPVPELRPLNAELIDLKMTNRPRLLFETVSKLAGVNVLFDPDYDSQQTIRSAQIDLTRTTLDQALDQLAVITKSFWKPLSPNAIFVTVDNPQKRRDYAEQVVKVFYLSNLTSPQEMQEILTVLRTVVDVQKVFSYSGQNALVVRADADTMALVEKLISDLDKPRSEVIVDVMVMEVSSTYIRNLQAAFAGTGITTGVAFVPRPGITTPGIQATTTQASNVTATPTTTANSTTSPVTSIPLSALGRISSSDFSLTTLPGATFEAVLSDSSTRVLQAPQIRAVSNTKAELKIGTKVPTASGSFQAGLGAVANSSPLVNTQFTYIDVGVNLSMTPQVMDNKEVSLHMDLDISQVNNFQNLGGISEPVIGQNKLTTDIRIRDGEVNLIGGIIQQTDSKSKTGIPGLASIPLIGNLFSGQTLEKDRVELVVAIIPHIVRGQELTPTNTRGIAAGNATQIKVNYAARAPITGERAQQPNLVTTPAAGPAAVPSGPPATAPMTPPVGIVNPPATAPESPTPATGPARVGFQPGSITTQLSSAVTVTVYGDNITDMISAAAQLRFDPRILRITNVSVGELASRNLPPLTPSQNILNDSGQADMSVSRGPTVGGISGAGGLFTVAFQAVGRGNTTVTLVSASLTGSTGQPINTITSPPLVVNVN